MSKISASVKKTIKEVKRLADGSIDEQIYACKELLQKKIFFGGKLKNGIDTSVIPELFPIILKFMESDNQVLQKEGVDFVASITYTPDMKTNTKLVIDAGAIPKLIDLLSSTNNDVLIYCLKAIASISYDFPEKVVENGVLPLIIQYLKSENQKILYHAAWFMDNVSYKCEEGVAAIVKADGIEPLLRILETKYNDVCNEALDALINIISCNSEICQRVLDYDALSSLKKLCDRVLVPKKPKRLYLGDLSERKLVKLLAIRLIKHVTSYGEEAQIDMITSKDFVPLILRQIRDGMTPAIKIESLETIKNIIAFKPTFLLSLINDQNLFTFYYNNLASTNANLVISVLTAMKNIIGAFEDKDLCRQKIQECGTSTKLRNLFDHNNEEIRRLAHLINAFVNGDVKPLPIPARNQKSGIIELNDDVEDATPAVAGTPQNCRRRKRPTNAQEGPLRRSKRFRRNLYGQTDADHSVTPDSVEDGDSYNDLDDHPGNSSPVHSSAVALDDDSTRDSSIPTNHSPANSGTVEADDFDDDILEIDEKKILIPPKSSPSDDFDNPSRPLSRQSPALPVAASTNNDDNFVVEKKSSTDAASAYPSVPVEMTAENTNNTAITTTSDDPSSQATTVPPSASLQPIPDQTTTPATNDGLPNANSFPPVSYCCPAEFLIRKYCSHLEIQFNRKNYAAFIQKMELTEITSNSQPATFHSTSDQTGFGCLSMLLTGSEDQADTIRIHTNKKFIDDLYLSRNFDEEKITRVIAPPFILKAEHFETIVAWFNCRIMVYSNGKWERYGDFDASDDSIPLFVLAKNSIQGSTHFDIVLSLKRDG